MKERKRILKKKLKEAQQRFAMCRYSGSIGDLEESNEYLFDLATERLAKIHELESELNAMTSNNMIKQAKIEVLKTKVRYLKRKCQDKNDIEEALERLNNVLVSKDCEITTLKQELHIATSKPADLSQCEDLMNEVAKRLEEKCCRESELEKQVAAFSKKAEILAAELKADKQIIADYTTEIDKQEEKIISLNKYIIDLQTRIQDKNKAFRDKDEAYNDAIKDAKYWHDACLEEKSKPWWKNLFNHKKRSECV